MPIPAVNAEKLGKKYGDFMAVGGLDLRIEEGEVFALVGPNGSGKSTTLKMISTILFPTSGRVEVFGADTVGNRKK